MCPWCRAKEVFENGESVHSEIYIPRVDKAYRIIEVPIKNSDGSVSKLNIYRDITSRRDQELKLRATEQDYRRLFEHVGVGVYISTKEGRFLNANQALLDMLGYAGKEEFLNMHIQTDLYVRPGDRLAFQAMIEENGRVINYPVDFKKQTRQNGPRFDHRPPAADHTGRVVGYEGICVDQSQIVKLEQRIRETHDFLNNIIHSSPNAIIGADIKGSIIVWNKGAEETLGYLSHRGHRQNGCPPTLLRRHRLQSNENHAGSGLWRPRQTALVSHGVHAKRWNAG